MALFEPTGGAGYVNLKVVADAAQAVQALNQVKSAVAGISEGGAKTVSFTENLKTLGAWLSKTISALGAVAAAAGVAFGVRELVNFVKESVNAAGRVQALDVALGQIAKNMGVSAQKARETVQAVHEMNITWEASYYAVTQWLRVGLNLEDLTKVILATRDAAKLTGKDVSDSVKMVVDSIVSGYTVQMNHIGFTRNAVQVYADYAKSIGKTSNELTELEKRQALVNYVISEGNSIAGVYPALTEQWAGRLTSLNRAMQDFQVAFGQIFNRAMLEIVNALYDEFMRLQRATNDLFKKAEWQKYAKDLAEVGKQLIDIFIRATEELVKGLLPGLKYVLDAIIKMGKDGTLKDWGEQVVFTMKAVGLAISGIVIALTAVSTTAYKWQREVGEALGSAAEWAVKLGSTITGGLVKAWDTLVSVVKVVTSVFHTVIAVLKDVATSVGSPVYKTFGTVWQGIVTVVKQAVSVITSVLSPIGSLAKTVASTVWGAFKKVIESIVNVFQAVYKWIKDVLSLLGSLVKAVTHPSYSNFKTAWEAITNRFQAAVTWIKNVLSAISNLVKAVSNSVFGSFKAVWDGIASAFSATHKAGQGLIGTLQGIWDKVKSFGGKFWDWLTGTGGSPNPIATPQGVNRPFSTVTKTEAEHKTESGYGAQAFDVPYASGTPVYAPASGTASFLSSPGSYGNFVQLKLGNGQTIVLAHFSSFPSGITAGTKGVAVAEGQLVGYSGSTGNSTGPHLHVEYRPAAGQSLPAGYARREYTESTRPRGGADQLPGMLTPEQVEEQRRLQEELLAMRQELAGKVLEIQDKAWVAELQQLAKERTEKIAQAQGNAKLLLEIEAVHTANVAKVYEDHYNDVHEKTVSFIEQMLEEYRGSWGKSWVQVVGGAVEEVSKALDAWETKGHAAVEAQAKMMESLGQMTKAQAEGWKAVQNAIIDTEATIRRSELDVLLAKASPADFVKDAATALEAFKNTAGVTAQQFAEVSKSVTEMIGEVTRVFQNEWEAGIVSSRQYADAIRETGEMISLQWGKSSEQFKAFSDAVESGLASMSETLLDKFEQGKMTVDEFGIKVRTLADAYRETFGESSDVFQAFTSEVIETSSGMIASMREDFEQGKLDYASYVDGLKNLNNTIVASFGENSAAYREWVEAFSADTKKAMDDAIAQYRQGAISYEEFSATLRQESETIRAVFGENSQAYAEFAAKLGELSAQAIADVREQYEQGAVDYAIYVNELRTQSDAISAMFGDNAAAYAAASGQIIDEATKMLGVLRTQSEEGSISFTQYVERVTEQSAVLRNAYSENTAEWQRYADTVVADGERIVENLQHQWETGHISFQEFVDNITTESDLMFAHLGDTTSAYYDEVRQMDSLYREALRNGMAEYSEAYVDFLSGLANMEDMSYRERMEFFAAHMDNLRKLADKFGVDWEELVEQLKADFIAQFPEMKDEITKFFDHCLKNGIDWAEAWKDVWTQTWDYASEDLAEFLADAIVSFNLFKDFFKSICNIIVEAFRDAVKNKLTQILRDWLDGVFNIRGSSNGISLGSILSFSGGDWLPAAGLAAAISGIIDLGGVTSAVGGILSNIPIIGSLFGGGKKDPNQGLDELLVGSTGSSTGMENLQRVYKEFGITSGDLSYVQSILFGDNTDWSRTDSLHKVSAMIKKYPKALEKRAKWAQQYPGFESDLSKLLGYHNPVADALLSSAGVLLGKSLRFAGLDKMLSHGQTWGVDFGKLFTQGVAQGVRLAGVPAGGGNPGITIHQVNYINNPQDWERNARDAFALAKRIWDGGNIDG